MIILIYNADLYESDGKTSAYQFAEVGELMDFLQSENTGFELKENYQHIFLNQDKQSIADFVDLELIRQMIEEMAIGELFYWNEHPLGWDFKIKKINNIN